MSRLREMRDLLSLLFGRGVKMKYQVGRRSFRSKREIESHVRLIFQRTPVGCVLNGDDLQFLRELINRHPYAAQKIGPGIEAIRVDLNTYWTPRKMFTLVRVDGSETDVSYRVCLYPPSKQQDFAKACRHAVIDDILEFKQHTFNAMPTKIARSCVR